MASRVIGIGPKHRVDGRDLYYKHYNRIYCRSLVTGGLRWAYELGPLDRHVGRIPHWSWGRRLQTLSYPEQDILIDGSLVFANVRVYRRRESLVAMDRITGELRWATGPIRPVNEEDMMTRYDATKVTQHDVRNALDAVLAGKKPPVEQTNPLGCNVKWVGKDAHWMPPEACDLV